MHFLLSKIRSKITSKLLEAAASNTELTVFMFHKNYLNVEHKKHLRSKEILYKRGRLSRFFNYLLSSITFVYSLMKKCSIEDNQEDQLHLVDHIHIV